MSKILHLEIFADAQWRRAATLTCLDTSLGYKGKVELVYEDSYATDFILHTDCAALSLLYPVNFEYHFCDRWPAFLLDLVPSGAARRYWLQKLNLPDSPQVDWSLLEQGATNPPGNIRIAPKDPIPQTEHLGFLKEDILTRHEDFIEYAYQCGAPITGSTGAQGDAPKFLLTQDSQGNWHADGALPDEKTQSHWIVKFPRGKHQSDLMILKCEAIYMQAANYMGLHVAQLPHHQENVLFIPRFDRKVKNSKVERLGLESLCSACGISEFGSYVSQEHLCEAIARFSSNPHRDLLEFVLRDVLNLALGNTDNHSRNTAFLKDSPGQVNLSPLYDFAPMFLDREGIARVCRWQCLDNETDRLWETVFSFLESEFDFDMARAKKKVAKFNKQLKSLPQFLLEKGLPQEVLERRLKDIELQHNLLKKVVDG